jgi:hypothetical protein
MHQPRSTYLERIRHPARLDTALQVAKNAVGRPKIKTGCFGSNLASNELRSTAGKKKKAQYINAMERWLSG